MRKVLFTHIDLDGAGCRILFQLVHPDIEVHHVNYGFDEDLENRKIMAEADEIYFTDISMSRATAELLNRCDKKLLLLDHHTSALDNLGDLNYNWIQIDTTKSGTMITYDYLKQDILAKYGSEALAMYERLAKHINDYDLWKFELEGDMTLFLQFLWSGIGMDNFCSRFLANPRLEFSQEEAGVAGESLDRLNESYQMAIDSLSVHQDMEGNTWALTKVDSMHSLLADRILKLHPEYTYIALMKKGNSVSFRSKTYEVRKIAEALGGGGHPLASACSIPENGFYDVESSINYREWNELPFR